MLERIRLVEEPSFSARFPAERLATVALTLRDGARFCSAPTTPRGDPQSALSDDEMLRKFRQLVGVLAAERLAAIERCVATLDSESGALRTLSAAILSPL